MNYSIDQLPTIETQRLLLRPITIEDAADMYDYAKKENVGPRAGWTPHETIEQTKEIIEGMIESKLTEDNVGVLAIFHKTDHKMIGSVGLHRLNQKAESAMLGYVLSPDYWGQGIMKEASIAMIEWSFDVLNLYRLECNHFDFNHQSKRVIEKLGFKFEGISRKRVVLPGGSRCDSHNYSILKPEYENKELPWQKN